MRDRLKVAIADDEAMVCVVVQDAIQFDNLGIELAGIAHDGAALLDLIRDHKPDIVIPYILVEERG